MDRGLMNRATRANGEPVSGFLLGEIARMTLISPDVCTDVEDYLAKRLQLSGPGEGVGAILGRDGSSSKVLAAATGAAWTAILNRTSLGATPYDEVEIRFKTLRIVRHVCQEGRPEFRRAMQRKVGTLVKTHQTFKGPVHPLRGEAPVRELREEATRCLETLFASDDPLVGQRTDTAMESRIQGFGSGVYDGVPSRAPMSSSFGSSAPPNGWTGGRRMEGFGNPYMPPPSGGDSSFGTGNMTTDAIKAGAAAGSEALVRGFTEAANLVSRYLPESVKHHIDQLSSTSSRPHNPSYAARSGYTSQTGSFEGGYASGSYYGTGSRPAGRQLGGEGSRTRGFRDRPFGTPADGRFEATSSGNHRGGRSKETWGAGSGVRGPMPWGGGSATSDSKTLSTPSTTSMARDPGEYESKLVADICAPGGVKISPPQEALAEFCGKCVNLDVEVLGLFLLQRLQETGSSELDCWQSKLRTLCVIEALVNPSISSEGVCSSMSQFLRENAEDVFEEVAGSFSQCRLRIARVRNLSGMCSAASSPGSRRKRELENAAGGLIDDLLDSTGDGEDVLGLSQPREETRNALSREEEGGGEDLLVDLGGRSITSPAACPKDAAGFVEDLLSLDLNPPPGSASAPSSSGAPTTSTTSGSASLFGSLRVKSPQPHNSAVASSSLFDAFKMPVDAFPTGGCRSNMQSQSTNLETLDLSLTQPPLDTHLPFAGLMRKEHPMSTSPPTMSAFSFVSKAPSSGGASPERSCVPVPAAGERRDQFPFVGPPSSNNSGTGFVSMRF